MSECEKEIDETIKAVCKSIQKENMEVKGYADTVMALAALIEARAKQY